MATHPFEVFRGYICQDYSVDEKKDDDDFDNDEQDWDDQELDAISSGALHIQPKKPPYRKVQIRSIENRQTVLVHGNFLSTHPWWEVKVILRPKTSMGTIRNGKQVYRGMTCQPSYRIRNDRWLDEGGKYGSVLVQFLTECKLEDTTKDHLMHYLRNKAPRSGPVNFGTLFGVLTDCELIEDEKTRGLLCLVKPYIMNSECGLLAQQALDNPTLFQLLPQLLPDRTVALLKQCAGDKGKLQRLETALKEKPWAFGFSTALRKETNVVLTEVSVDRFKQAGILDTFERHIQDGLHCYYVLKRKCWNEGHTFLWEKGLRMQLQKNYPGYKVEDWKKMWEFLKSVDAIHCKEKGKGKWVKIFLYRYWKAEDKIVKCLGKILDRGEQDLSCLKDALDVDDAEAEAQDGAEKGVNEQKAVLDGCGSVGKPETNHHQETSANCNIGQKDPSSLESIEDNDVSLSQLIDGVNSDQSVDEEDDISGFMDKTPIVPILDKKALEEKDEENFKNDRTQRAAARSIRENPFTIVSGKGGCGKTHVVCKVLEDYPSYAVTMSAPTGKAASNLRKRSHGKIEAFTLHQISWQYTMYMRKLKEYNKEKKVDNEAKEPQFKFDTTEILVVDECSMVPITVFSNVLHALLYQGKLKKLILLGDYRQLPSVEPGNLLSDLYKVFKQYGWSIELTQNHRSESELIVNNATEISSQRMPIFDATRGFSLVELPENDGFDDVQNLHEVVQNLYSSDESIKDHKRSQFVAFRKADCSILNDWCCPLYANHNTQALKDGKLTFVFQEGDKICPTHNANVTDYLADDKNNSQVAASTSFQQNDVGSQRNDNEGASSTIQQNVIHAAKAPESSLQQNNATTCVNAGLSVASTNQRDVDEAAEIAFLEQLCSQNPASPYPGEGGQMEGSFAATGGGDNDEKKKDEDKKETRICNGEIYFIEHVHELQEAGKKKDEHVTMSDGDADLNARQSLCAPLRELRGKAAIKHAWARTIHTYQGSESETVIYLLGNSGAQNWQHVYTAITRGKTRVYIIGTKSQLLKAIRRDARPRNTELKEMLMEEIIPKLKQMQKQELSQTCSRQQQHHQQQMSQHCNGNLTMRANNTTLCKGVTSSQIGNSSMRNSQMHNAQRVTCSQIGNLSSRNSQMCNGPQGRTISNSQVCRPSQPYQYGMKRTEQGHNSAPARQVGRVLSQVGKGSQPGGQTILPPPQPTRTFDFFQPLMTSTQVTSSSRNQSSLRKDQWRPKTFSSPKKVFTSIKDLPPKSAPCKEISNHLLNVNGIVHSTPKQGASCDKQQKDDQEYDDWSHEWSAERLQQVIDMETTAIASQQERKSPPPLYDDEDDKSDACESPSDSEFKSTPPNGNAMPEAISPFTPNSSMRLRESWGVRSPPRNNVAKRLYTEMKESPITDGLPNKKRNDFNESDLF